MPHQLVKEDDEHLVLLTRSQKLVVVAIKVGVAVILWVQTGFPHNVLTPHHFPCSSNDPN